MNVNLNVKQIIFSMKSMRLLMNIVKTGDKNSRNNNLIIFIKVINHEIIQYIFSVLKKLYKILKLHGSLRRIIKTISYN